MRYGIMINMDYEYHSHELAIALFEHIRHSLLQNGFRLDGRVLTIALPAGEVANLVRLVLDELDAQQAVSGHSIFNYIREFYGFDLESARNLLLPEPDVVAVEEYHNEPVFDEVYRRAC